MTVFILRRLAQTLLVLFVTSALVFGGLYLVGDPLEILVNPAADEAEKARAAVSLGLDRPILEQYGIFVRSALAGDLGKSFVFGRPAIEVILERIPATLGSRSGMVILVGLGIPLGICWIVPNKFQQNNHGSSILGLLPTFWSGCC
jgi:peptide/nickel transport system permease protein